MSTPSRCYTHITTWAPGPLASCATRLGPTSHHVRRRAHGIMGPSLAVCRGMAALSCHYAPCSGPTPSGAHRVVTLGTSARYRRLWGLMTPWPQPAAPVLLHTCRHLCYSSLAVACALGFRLGGSLPTGHQRCQASRHRHSGPRAPSCSVRWPPRSTPQPWCPLHSQYHQSRRPKHINMWRPMRPCRHTSRLSRLPVGPCTGPMIRAACRGCCMGPPLCSKPSPSWNQHPTSTSLRCPKQRLLRTSAGPLLLPSTPTCWSSLASPKWASPAHVPMNDGGSSCPRTALVLLN